MNLQKYSCFISKNAEHLHVLHKIKDEKTGGYVLGQNIALDFSVEEQINRKGPICLQIVKRSTREYVRA